MISMYPYAIGLDIGVTSVGWATLALDEDDRPYGIINMGSRIFDAAENPKNGDSLAAPRREKRSMRRRLRRHRHRNERIRGLLIEAGILTREELDSLFEGKLPDIYALRVKALDEAVTPQEFARILLHISQRRGFRSNRKNPTGKEDGALLGAVSANKALMAEKGYRTVGEMLLRDPAYAECKRNKGGSYIATVGRDMTEDEVRLIFAAQRKLGASFASEDIEERYLAILLSQRSFDAGPGEGSPYAGNQIERMIGGCTFEPGELRAAKATYSFEYFTLLQNVNHLRLVTGGESVPLTKEQRCLLVELAHKTKDPTFARIRRELAVPEGTTFNAVSYPRDASVEEAEKKAKLKGLAAYHEMKTAFNKLSKNHIDDLSREQRNEIGRVLSIFKTSDKIRPLLKAAGLTEEEIDAAETLSFSKFGHISVKACDKLIPFLEQGMNYNDACAAAGYDFKAHGGEKSRLLHPTEEDFEDVTSPVVRRAVSQTVKVLNAIIRERGGSPTYINIELAREMAKDFSERNKLKRDMDARGAENERIMERIRTEYGKAKPTGQDLVKYRLWCEQHEECAYSQKHISIEHLFDADYVEIDHIIPYSISFDDSYKNKVLVLAKENRDKGNRLPLEYLTGKRRDDFVVWVENNVRDYRKKQKLLKEKVTEDDEKRFKDRALQDTKHMSAFLMNYIADNLEFAPFVSGRKKHVTAVNGVVTGYMRKRWGIEKIRENGDLHHAVDAVVVGCTTDGMIREVSRYAEYRECEYMQTEEGSIAVSPATGEVLRRFPYPWPRFRAELEARLGADPARAVMEQGFPVYLNEDIKVRPLFVSRMPRRKVSGAAHLETIKSAKALGEGVVIVKKDLTALKLDKDGEIADYYNPASDRLLYEALKARLHRFGGDAAKAFAEPFRKPK
ncbi:MAG: type II CRISPR RNA-guided endonuclease Cas9, partial [Oscillospiraceae bacterium]|nr:type II CRISPR RNA-guided endonuclease Cas9 [Oscillospiraceae bacterium]